MGKSILFSDTTQCAICGSPYVEIHHIFYGTANRRHSEKLGYVIPLCYKHHRDSHEGIHFNKNMAVYYKRIAQTHFEDNLGNRDEFINRFGKSYL